MIWGDPLDNWRDNRLVFWVLAAPGTLWLVVFFLAPLAIVCAMSFGEQVSLVDTQITGTLANYVRAIGK